MLIRYIIKSMLLVNGKF